MRSLFKDALEPTLNRAFTRHSDSGANNPGMNSTFITSVVRRGRVLLMCAGLPLVLATTGNAWARDDDHERALKAVQAGEVMPLQQALEKLARSHPGHVLEVELERDNGRWVYEIRLLREGGRLARVELDARTGELLRIKERARSDR